MCEEVDALIRELNYDIWNMSVLMEAFHILHESDVPCFQVENLDYSLLVHILSHRSVYSVEL